MTTNAQRARKLAKKVDEAPTGHSSRRGSVTTVEAVFAEIVRVAEFILKMKDLGHDRTHPEYSRGIGTLDGLVWCYCFAWNNSYEPHFTAARARVRREAIKKARRLITEESL